MQRIVKRFLLHKQRESDEVGEADFDELKQDLQMVRYEMMNDLKRYRDENNRLISNIQAGVLLLGEELYKNSSGRSSRRFREYKETADKNYEFENDEDDELIEDIQINLTNRADKSKWSNAKGALRSSSVESGDSQDVQSDENLDESTNSTKSLTGSDHQKLDKIKKDLHVINEEME